jgi:hypothetical protein
MFKDDNLQELLNKYRKHVNDREIRRLNFNRKDRWQQRELDDIFKNFDVKNAKFKDFSKLAREANILNKKEFTSVDEIYYYLEELFKDGFLEQHISSALDVFLKDINFFKAEDLKTKSFRLFLRELSTNMLSFSDDMTIYKTAKFLDWFNIVDPYCWYNLERIVISKKETIKVDILLKTLNHFANQNQGSTEFYDLYQYLYWSDHFEKVSNGDYISLAYCMFITTQGRLYF